MNVRTLGAVITISLLVSGYVLYGRFGPGSALDTPAATRIDAQLQSGEFEIYRAMKTQFPEAYGSLIAELAELETEGATAAEMAASGQAALEQLRRNSGPNLLRADPAEIREIVVLSRDLHDRVLTSEGRAVCNKFATSGPQGLGASVVDYLPALDAQMARLVTAMGRARSRPPYAAVLPATSEDTELAYDRMIAGGADPALREVLRTLDSSGDLCAALIALLDTILDMPSERGERLRATYVRDLAMN